MNLTDVLSRPRTLRLGRFISRRTPTRAGYRLLWWVSGLVSRLRPAVYDVIAANVGQVLAPEAGPETVGATARRIIYYFLQGYYDLFRAMGRPYEELLDWVEVPDSLKSLLHAAREAGRGLIVVVAHVGNFDLGGQIVSAYAPNLQVISLADPHPGFRQLNDLRQLGGARITPLGPAALRQAFRTLREAGVLVVGGDRPVSDLDRPVPFFGRPTRVPSAHVRLALRTNALVAVTGCVYRPETGRYSLELEPPLEMVRTGDREEEVQVNMRHTLDALENLIRRHLDQWMMFVPVWPEPSTE
ncbi:MAG: hypothetical protein PVF47_08180 [Anaerolineae bacterium]|jgi:KDO2-lipid IV(A) lauroyltransferase